MIASTRTDIVSASMHISMAFSRVIRQLEEFVILDFQRDLVVAIIRFSRRRQKNNTLESDEIAN
jgi:hypothetical protein